MTPREAETEEAAAAASEARAARASLVRHRLLVVQDPAARSLLAEILGVDLSPPSNEGA